MTKQFKIILGLSLIIAVALFMVGNSYGFKGKSSYRLSKEPFRGPIKGSSFSKTGKFIGSINGQIKIGNEKIFVTEETSVYVAGEGLKKTGYFVTDATLYVSGKIKRGVPTATYIVVRPSHSSRASSPRSSADTKYEIRSKANSDVGEYVENVPG